MATEINKVIFIEKNPFSCFNCKNTISQFKKAHLDIFDYKSKQWRKITVSECPYCQDLFGIENIGLH